MTTEIKFYIFDVIDSSFLDPGVSVTGPSIPCTGNLAALLTKYSTLASRTFNTLSLCTSYYLKSLMSSSRFITISKQLN